jgi:hypothetical protein
LLFPIPDFSIKVHLEDTNSLISKGFNHRYLNKGIASAFGSLGAMPMAKNQASVYVIKLPPRSSIQYFSLQPYLFQTGRKGLVGNFPQDLPFASMTDSFNLQNLEKMRNKYTRVREWFENGSTELTIIVVATHNKLLAQEIYDTLKPGSGKFSDIPMTCLPIPAGSTYGSVFDPLDRPMLKETRTNLNYQKDSPLYDWQTETIGIVGRIAPADESKVGDTGDIYTEWKNNVMDQENCFVVGVEGSTKDYEAFKLEDQNGDFDDNGKWARVGVDDKTYTLSNWKKQEDYVSGGLVIKGERDVTVGSIDQKIKDITKEMKAMGYDVSRDIEINSSPSPFPHYCDYAASVGGKAEDWTWSQSGVDILQHNVAAFGDCRDTVYPTSNTFCLGQFDVLVLVANNFSGVNGDIGYNNLNVYEAEAQTSLASLRGDGLGEAYSMAASRSDLTCVLPGSVGVDSFQFIPTGSHSNLSGSTTTTFFAQSRCYFHEKTGTSPRLSVEQSRYIVRIFSPCKSEKIWPSICHDYESGLCSDNTTNGSCANDLMAKSSASAEKSDMLSSVICGKLRLQKTSNKTVLITFMAVIVCVFVATLILNVITSVNNSVDGFILSSLYNDLQPLFIPYAMGVIAMIIVYSKLSNVLSATAYDVSQARK